MQSLRLFFILMTFAVSVYAQQEPKVRSSSTYQSEIDKDLTIKKISLLPVADNVGGIYSRPSEDLLKDLLAKDPRFQSVDSQYAGTLVSIDDLEANPQQIKDISLNINADALMAARLTKGPDGISIHLSLFLKADGMLISREIEKIKATADIKTIKSTLTDLFSKVMKQIPYDGLVLSRNNSLVTINIGKKYGLTAGQTVSASIILKANRHPKFHFIISTEKEVLGKIKLQKVDDTISFGQIIVEKDPGSIQKDSKISGVEFVQYAETPLGDAFQSNPQSPAEKKITFGENPKEWKPADPPTFGKVGAQLGLGQAHYNANVDGDALSGSNNMYPLVKLYGELWFTSEWLADFELQQGIISMSNPRSGSSPSKLSENQSSYLLSFGYNFMIQDDFFGPSVLFSLGFANYELNVDSSSPQSLPATRYKGMFVGLRGSMPVSDDKRWNLGAGLKYFIDSRVSTEPATSGDKSTITQFSLLGFYQQNTHLRFVGTLEFSLFSSTFDGSSPSDISQKYTTLTGGIEYLF
jgi:hypothetical protein